jgi:hypothetical protein
MKGLLSTGFLSLAMGIALAQSPGIQGQVLWIEGNHMPGPGKHAKPVKGVKREIWVYEPTRADQATVTDGQFYSNIQTRLIKKGRSKGSGKFYIPLPPGEYSLFIKEKQGLYANSLDGNGRIQVIKIQPGPCTVVLLQITYAAAF